MDLPDMMEKERTASPELPGPLLWLGSHVRPAALGVCAAFVLGGAGFGAGCLYAQIIVPEPAAIRVAGPGAGVALAMSLPAAATATDGMAIADGMATSGGIGGPEDRESLDVQPAAVKPAAATPMAATPMARRSGQTIAMARPVSGGWISSRYGQRSDPFTGQPAVHHGLDYAGLDSSPILAAASGVVTRTGRQGGYGNFIEIDHGRGWVTRYGHNAINLVTPGDYVKPGQAIALMGATGRATGTHLHFEVLYRGRHQNPARLVPRSA